MKRLLQLSLFTNLGLVCSLVAVFFLSRNRQEISAGDRHWKDKPPEVAEPVRVSNDQITNQPFRWSQLESTNYQAYVSNLRDIGCPEQTIRDIITADVISLYSEKRRQLLANQGKEQDPTRLRTKLDQLQQDQTALIATLLGDSNSENPLARVPAVETSAVAKEERNPANRINPAASAEIFRASQDSRLTETEPADASGSNPQINGGGFGVRSFDRPVSTPLIFQPGGNGMIDQPDDLQAIMIGHMQQTFVSSVGDTSDPSSPQYRWRYQDAQERSDAQYRAQFGWSAFNKKQVEAARH